ncbi:hypothetical protein EV360DRAFT_57282, partial [Lentinula raphanica]
HNLIALQIAQTKGGAELYPADVQVRIEGDEMGTLMNEELVQLPGVILIREFQAWSMYVLLTRYSPWHGDVLAKLNPS